MQELRNWRKQQLEETAQWGADHQNNDNLVFTEKNGEPYDPHRVYKAFVASVARLARAAAKLVPRAKTKPNDGKPKKGKKKN